MRLSEIINCSALENRLDRLDSRAMNSGWSNNSEKTKVPALSKCIGMVSGECSGLTWLLFSDVLQEIIRINIKRTMSRVILIL
jgi:hypothetical protein